ncbi:S46 family peptidase [Halocola ammonii]
MKKFLTLFMGIVILSSTAKADEGMWLMNMLNRIYEAEMKGMGLNLTPDEIYNINQASMKDAIVRLNGGMCTAEVISDQGLVLTNHHCAYGAVQSLSSVDNDYLTEGFWAYDKSKELPISNFVASFLVRIEDVTERINSQLNEDMTEEERAQTIAKLSQAIQAEATEGNEYDAEVKSFFHGNEFYLMVYNTYRDVRLVGVPPESIGKFGGDTDNWMWPRHTGDFAMIRIYADRNNEPADYTKDNQPYEPKHHLPISVDGVEANDFTMIMGFPGSTDRYLTSWGVDQAINIHNPTVVNIRDKKLKTMKKHMDAEKDVRIKYAAKYAQTANYWKYYIGQTKGLKRLNVVEKKRQIEENFNNWVNSSDKLKETYGEVLPMIQEYYDITDETVKADVYALEAGLIGSDIVLFAFRFNRVYSAAMKEEDEEKRKMMLKSFEATAEDFFKDYDMETDRDLFVNLLSMYKENVSKDQWPDIFNHIDDKYKGSVERFADKMYDKSFLVNKIRLMEFLDNPKEKTAEKDLALKAAQSIFKRYQASMVSGAQDKYDKGYRLFVQGLRKMNEDKLYYPDANSTMRLTYGKVGDYYPEDAVHYDYITTSKGVLEKYDPNDPEFVVPEELIKLLEKEQYGRWANENGDLVICFISNNDITGGNSGSPVINGDGELIGLAFDGNWEAMSGDIAFEPELQRTISVDIRYVLFIVDKFAGAQNIIDELTLVKNDDKKMKEDKEAKKPQMEEAPMKK